MLSSGEGQEREVGCMTPAGLSPCYTIVSTIACRRSLLSFRTMGDPDLSNSRLSHLLSCQSEANHRHEDIFFLKVKLSSLPSLIDLNIPEDVKIKAGKLAIKRSSTRGKTWKENSTSHQPGAALSQKHLKEKIGTKGTKFWSGEILSDAKTS